jgi:hypothetical protein
MRKRIIAALSTAALAIAVIGGAAAVTVPAQAAPDGPAVHLDLDRTSTTLTAISGSYTNLTADSSKWSQTNNLGGFTVNNDGIFVPVTGVYEVSWSAILTSGGSGICGFTTDNSTPNGGVLFAIGPIVNLAAATGNGTFTGVIANDDPIEFWCYGSGGSISLQAVKATNITVTLIDEL